MAADWASDPGAAQQDGAHGSVHELPSEHGGQGSVSKVTYHRKPHAAKEISLRDCKNPTEMKLKIEEIQNEFAIMIKGNQCPEIIHSYGIIQRRESLIIIMEYASNGSLRDYLNDHKNKSTKMLLLLKEFQIDHFFFY